MPNIQEYAAVCFGESNKDSKAEFDKDCVASIWTVKNRVNGKNPIRRAAPLDGYSSVGGDEWNKFMSGSLSAVKNKGGVSEEWAAKRAYQLAGAVARGEIPDPTDGADHIWNPELDDPNDWNTKLNPGDTKLYEMYYPITYETKKHKYLKETLRTPKTKVKANKSAKSKKSKK